MLFGARADARPGRHPARSDDAASTSLTSAILDFDGGVATFTCSTRVETDQRVHVYGTDGPGLDRHPVQHPARSADARSAFTAGGDPPVAPATETLTFATADPYTVEAERSRPPSSTARRRRTHREDAVANLRVIERIFAAGGGGGTT